MAVQFGIFYADRINEACEIFGSLIKNELKYVSKEEFNQLFSLTSDLLIEYAANLKMEKTDFVQSVYNCLDSLLGTIGEEEVRTEHRSIRT